MPHPTTTFELFQHDRVAQGYASARPYLHPQVLARTSEIIGPGPFRSALDVGCGTGMSSVALRALATSVVGVDASTEMLQRARQENGVLYAAARAETPPFADASFDLVLACGSMDWVDRPRFMPRAAKMIASGGWLVSLDFGDTGRSPDIPALGDWYDGVFGRDFPRPPAADPMITAAEASANGFALPIELDFSSACSFTAREYALFLMTESNVVAAIEYGQGSEADVLAHLEADLDALFAGGERRIAFGGYIQALRRH